LEEVKIIMEKKNSLDSKKSENENLLKEIK
jgi:hypothetical protein